MSKLYAAISLLLLVGCRQSENVSVLSVDVEAELREEVSIFDVFSKVELVALESLQPLSNHSYGVSVNFLQLPDRFNSLKVAVNDHVAQ